jgi:cellobiose phosphorylase
VEPYVVAADVYAVAPHIRRGGWTWYTGSAGWMYRLLVETLLGVHLEGDQLRLIPACPKAGRAARSTTATGEHLSHHNHPARELARHGCGGGL